MENLPSLKFSFSFFGTKDLDQPKKILPIKEIFPGVVHFSANNFLNNLNTIFLFLGKNVW